jgi:hypothetical protein
MAHGGWRWDGDGEVRQANPPLVSKAWVGGSLPHTVIPLRSIDDLHCQVLVCVLESTVAGTSHHKLGVLSNKSMLWPGSGDWTSEVMVWAGQAPPEGGGPILGLFPAPCSSLAIYHSLACRSSSLISAFVSTRLFPVCLSVSVSYCPFCKDAGQIRLGIPPSPHLSLIVTGSGREMSQPITIYNMGIRWTSGASEGTGDVCTRCWEQVVQSESHRDDSPRLALSS